MRTIRVDFADGNHLITDISGTEAEIRDYYLGQFFNFGDTDEHPEDRMVEAVAVTFLASEENDMAPYVTVRERGGERRIVAEGEVRNGEGGTQAACGCGRVFYQRFVTDEPHGADCPTDQECARG